MIAASHSPDAEPPVDNRQVQPRPQQLRLPRSITHQHLASIVNTLLTKQPRAHVRLLDFGYGNGQLLAYLSDTLPVLQPNTSFELIGLESVDADVQRAGFLQDTLRFLSEACPDRDWQRHLTAVSVSQDWPFPADHFDFIVSNQVFEHVSNYDLVLGEIGRTLTTDGASINIFPLKERFYESHVEMPLIHRIQDVDVKRLAMSLCFALGMRSSFRRELDLRGYSSPAEFIDDYSVVLLDQLTYASTEELFRLAKQNGLCVSFRFTKEFYLAKLASLLGHRVYEYRHANTLLDLLAFRILRRIDCVTVTFRRLSHRNARSSPDSRPAHASRPKRELFRQPVTITGV
ncbi:MAG: methyltransferase domain-containing protein [Pseudomonadota bacterium]